VSKVYKIHPGIGIARVGPSKSGFFLAPETVGGPPLELSDKGEIPFAGYKDARHLMRRQAARFRVYEYDKDDASGRETLQREIKASDATIEWTVRLAARKAAGVTMRFDESDDDGALIVTPGPESNRRNGVSPRHTPADLIAAIDLTATGEGYEPPVRPMARFMGGPLYIGEARTDHEGRLLVLGGEGIARTWIDPPALLVHFLNNPGWHDDIADGMVDARIKLKSTGEQPPVTGAWVITAPPDFAPGIAALTTLQDVAEQACLPPPKQVSYVQDIAPMLSRAASIYWVNQRDAWGKVRQHLRDNQTKLADPSPQSKPVRDEMRSLILSLEEEGTGMIDYRLTARQKTLLAWWARNDFVAGPEPGRADPNEAQVLDAASLSACVGGGFFPGIEAGLLLRNTGIWDGLGRLTRGEFDDRPTSESSTRMRLYAGALTERMACPWQADFMECQGAWWPAQRPDLARYIRRADGGVEPAPGPPWPWDRSLVFENDRRSHESHRNMVCDFAKLGVIEPVDHGGVVVFAETGRDPDLDKGA
jgi:hypothetical protein